MNHEEFEALFGARAVPSRRCGRGGQGDLVGGRAEEPEAGGDRPARALGLSAGGQIGPPTWQTLIGD